MYLTQRMSIPMIHEKTGMPLSTVRNHLRYLDVKLRSTGEGQKVCGRTGGGARLGRKFGPFSKQARQNMKAARIRWGALNAKGIRTNSRGYIEITRGPNKGRLLHDVIMEIRLGRPLQPDECVHHIDHKPSNNCDDNLALMTKTGHSRHHRLLEAKINPRKRGQNGRYT